MYTYIMKHKKSNKYYCGKTNNIDRRMEEHTNDRWKNYQLLWYVIGDYEKRIKKFGVNQFINCLRSPTFKKISPEV